MMILDNPGAREDRQGNSFLCGTRETLQRGMREAGLDTDSVYVTYLLKCRPIRAYNKPEAREACSPHLQIQLQEKKPLVLFGFGNVVAGALFPLQENVSVKELRGSWHEFQEIPIGFIYHPLAVRRRPNLMKFFVDDLIALKVRWERDQPPINRGTHKKNVSLLSESRKPINLQATCELGGLFICTAYANVIKAGRVFGTK